MLSAFLIVLGISSCGVLKLIPGKEYAKPQIRCESGRNKGNGNEKSDCWIYGEIGTKIDLSGE